MTEYCEVAVPVPLDQLFTYKLDRGISTEAGARVLVPFRERRLIGIVTELHDRAPAFAAKNVLELLDESGTPALTEELVRLGRWISVYYLAPIGEVFRTMLPLTAEFRREVLYSITDEGHTALHLAGNSGSSARSRRTPEDQDAEYRVLNYLSARDNALEPALRLATRASLDILTGMLRKKWIARFDVSHRTNAVRTRQVAQLKTAEGKLNTNQRLLHTGEARNNRNPRRADRFRAPGASRTRASRKPRFQLATAVCARKNSYCCRCAYLCRDFAAWRNWIRQDRGLSGGNEIRA